MRALVQRVASARVETDGQVVGRIGTGLLVYVAVGIADGSAQAEWLAEKVAGLRIFPDEAGKLNLSVRDARGDVLVVSNFTLLADARRGRRPAFAAAAASQAAEPVHQAFCEALRRQGVTVATGAFGATMAVHSAAAGPVNVLIDSPPQGER